MYPPSFEYFAPSTLDEALAILERFGDEAKPLAGGQSLIPLMKLRFAVPRAVVDLNRIAGLDVLAEDRGTLRIGTEHDISGHHLRVALGIKRHALRLDEPTGDQGAPLGVVLVGEALADLGVQVAREQHGLGQFERKRKVHSHCPFSESVLGGA